MQRNSEQLVINRSAPNPARRSSARRDPGRRGPARRSSARSSSARRSHRRTSHRRQGWISTIELLFVLPVILSVGLISVQLILVHTAYQRVQSAAIEGACVAAAGGDMDEIEDAVGLSLGYLAGAGFELTREYITAVTPPMDIPIGDRVAIGVRIPMGNVTTNYLGLLGGSVNDLQVNSVAIKTLTVVIPGPAYNGS